MTGADALYYKMLEGILGADPSLIRTLRRGDKGDDVRSVQLALARAGNSPGSIDGDFGKKTEEATRKFQKSRGLTQDGIVGPATLAALGLAKKPAVPAQPAPTAGREAVLVELAQSAVEEAGRAAQEAASVADTGEAKTSAEAKAVDAEAKAQLAVKAATESGNPEAKKTAEAVLDRVQSILTSLGRPAQLQAPAAPSTGSFLTREYAGVPGWGWGALGVGGLAFLSLILKALFGRR